MLLTTAKHVPCVLSTVTFYALWLSPPARLALARVERGAHATFLCEASGGYSRR